MKFLHTMVRVLDLEKSLDFYVRGLGLIEIKRKDYEQGRFTLVYLATARGEPEIELTYNWDQKEAYPVGRSFGHVAFEVEDIYATCSHLQKMGIQILRPPRDGHMAFVRSPDQVSVELLQKNGSLPKQEPWASMPSQGEW